jgi:two-component system, OmpR family, phosphate regulon response regulator OmpR
MSAKKESSVITPKVLIVDDDARLRNMLQKYLTEQHFSVKAVESGKEMDRYLARQHVDVIVLDLMMPIEDGLSICRRLRQANNQIPILMLSAKGDDVDRIMGLELGADDYLPKPFNPRELIARISSLLRRQPKTTAAAPETEQAIIHFGEFTLDLSTRQLMKGEQKVVLTSGEFAILKVLCKHPHEPLSRDKLMHLVKGREFEVFDRSIDVQISRLRKLVEPDPGKPRYIQTVWGLGYVFVPDEQKQ